MVSPTQYNRMTTRYHIFVQVTGKVKLMSIAERETGGFETMQSALQLRNLGVERGDVVLPSLAVGKGLLDIDILNLRFR